MGKKVKIAYQVKIDLDGEELSGACMAGDNLILISTTAHETEREVLDTLAHELFHYVVDKSGLSGLLGIYEEPTTECLEENFLPLFNFNRRKWRKKEDVTIGSKT